MTSLNENKNDIFAELPFSEDGMLDIQQVARKTTENFVNNCMSDDADQYCEEHNTYRNGYRQRGLKTASGMLNINVPKVREGTYFPEHILIRYNRCDQALRLAIQEIVVHGVSTRKINKIASKLGIEQMSASTVSRLTKDLDACAKELSEKYLGDHLFPYVWLDATYLNVRLDGHVVSSALVSAIGVNEEGKRQVLGFNLFFQEDEDSWSEFIQSLKKRGLKGVKLVISDAHKGLVAAIQKELLGVSWQRCIVHFERDVMKKAKNKKQRAAIGKILYIVFQQNDANTIRKYYKIATEAICSFCPSAKTCMEEAEASIFTYLDFPEEHHRRIRTNNVEERTNKEIKRRSRVISVFFSASSLIRYIGALLQELDEDWQTRCWFNPETLAQLYEENEEEVKEEKEEDMEKKAHEIIWLILEEYKLVQSSGKEAA